MYVRLDDAGRPFAFSWTAYGKLDLVCCLRSQYEFSPFSTSSVLRIPTMHYTLELRDGRQMHVYQRHRYFFFDGWLRRR